MKKFTERDICYKTQAQEGMNPPQIRIDRKSTLWLSEEKTQPMTGKRPLGPFWTLVSKPKSLYYKS
jgi:hypothetical protein